MLRHIVYVDNDRRFGGAYYLYIRIMMVGPQKRLSQLEAHPASYPMGTGPFPGGKARPGRDANHSPHLVPRS
jgi:hypothetical protein